MPERDFRIDALRGLLLIIMTIDHLPGYWQYHTYQPFGFVSAAEGFIFLSGYVAGLICSRRYAKSGWAPLRKWAWQRAETIYTYHLITFFTILLVAGLLLPTNEIWRELSPLFYDGPTKAALLGAVLLYQPAYLDVLPIYVLSVLLIPALIPLFFRQKEKIILLISTLIWVIAQFGASDWIVRHFHAWMPIYLGHFDILGFQLLFVTGLYVGYRKHSKRISLSCRIKWLPYLAVILFLFLFLLRRYIIIIPAIHTNLQIMAHVGRLGPLRLVNFFTTSFLISYAFRTFRRIPNIRWLSFLGRHSLQVFTFHVAIIYAVKLIDAQWMSQPFPLQIMLVLTVILALTIPAQLHQFYQSKNSSPTISLPNARASQYLPPLGKRGQGTIPR